MPLTRRWDGLAGSFQRRHPFFDESSALTGCFLVGRVMRVQAGQLWHAHHIDPILGIPLQQHRIVRGGSVSRRCMSRLCCCRHHATCPLLASSTRASAAVRAFSMYRLASSLSWPSRPTIAALIRGAATCCDRPCHAPTAGRIPRAAGPPSVAESSVASRYPRRRQVRTARTGDCSAFVAITKE